MIGHTKRVKYSSYVNLLFEMVCMAYFRHHCNARALTSSNKWAQDYQQKCTAIYCKIQCTCTMS